MFQYWKNVCLNNNRSNFTQTITYVVRLETAVSSAQLCATMCGLNVYHFLLYKRTVFQRFCQCGCGSTVTYQCVFHIHKYSCADKCAFWEIHELSTWSIIPSFPSRTMIVIRTEYLWSCPAKTTRLEHPEESLMRLS